MVREGLARLEGVDHIAKHPDPATATCEIRTRDGRLPDPGLMGRRLLALRVGARLRGIEITGDGRLEREGTHLFLRLSSSGERVQLAALKTKVQLDVRSRRPEPASRREHDALDRLRREAPPDFPELRVTGPLTVSPESGQAHLEVRDFFWFSPAQPPVRELQLGINVNGPYGLVEPWTLIRDGLSLTKEWSFLAETPRAEQATARARTVTSLWPNLVRLRSDVAALGAGASLRGVEVELDGWVVSDRGRPVLNIRDGTPAVSLAPLTRKVQWDTRERMESGQLPDEREAFRRIESQAGSRPRLARIIGPLVQSGFSLQWLVEVRQFVWDPNPGDPMTLSGLSPCEPSRSTEARNAVDTEPPMVPRFLTARHENGQIVLSWDPNPEPDLDGYNVFRSGEAGGDYIQIAAGIVPNRCVFRAADPGAVCHFVVTARDTSGNESGYSSPATLRIPARAN